MISDSDLWLAIDTASAEASVALCNGHSILAEQNWRSRRNHTRELGPRVQAMLTENELPATALRGIAVAVGPGSYTGLRIGLSLAKGLALAADAKLVGVPTLHALAAPLSPPWSSRTTTLWSVLQAGRGRVVAAAYPPVGPSHDAWPDPSTLTVSTVPALAGLVAPGDWVAGELGADDAQRLAEAGARVVAPPLAVRRAAWLATLGRVAVANGDGGDPATVEPIYPGGAP